MSPLEIIAIVFTLSCVYLTIKRNIWCWPLGIIGVIAFGITMYQAKLYSDMGLQIVFLFQSIYGWYIWTKEPPAADEKIRITLLSNKERAFALAFIIAFTTSIGYLVNRFTDGAIPFWDALTTAISLVANWLLARRVFENWILWVIVDVMYIVLFYQRGLTAYSVLYFVFLILATSGLLEWRKKLQLQRA